MKTVQFKTRLLGMITIYKCNLYFVKLKEKECVNFIKAYKIPINKAEIYLNSFIPYQSLKKTQIKI